MHFITILSQICTIIFFCWPVWLLISIILRYRYLKRIVENYLAIMDASLLHLETNKEPNISDFQWLVEQEQKLQREENKAAANSAILSLWLARFHTLHHQLKHFFGVEAAKGATNYVEFLRDFIEYHRLVGVRALTHEQYVKFKHKHLRMRKELTAHLEYCRTSTETLPYIGILGTVLGFLLSLDGIMAASETNWSGLVLAMSSTAVALGCILWIKLNHERIVVPKYVQFESSLQVIEDYQDNHSLDQNNDHLTLHEFAAVLEEA